jgi:hypothetical protein
LGRLFLLFLHDVFNGVVFTCVRGIELLVETVDEGSGISGTDGVA